MIPLTFIVWTKIQWKSMGSKTIWLPAFLCSSADPRLLGALCRMGVGGGLLEYRSNTLTKVCKHFHANLRKKQQRHKMQDAICNRRVSHGVRIWRVCGRLVVTEASLNGTSSPPQTQTGALHRDLKTTCDMTCSCSATTVCGGFVLCTKIIFLK